MKIGIQGNPGSYHEQAAQKLRSEGEIVYYQTFREVFEALEAEAINSAIVAIANNRVQFITEPYDRLTAKGHNFTITGEVCVRVEHALLAPKGAKLENITEVHSQAPALGQCMYFLEDKLSHATLVEQHDTAGSAQLVVQLNDPTKAAIASEKAAELYGLEILQREVQDDTDNITRFLELQKSKLEASSNSDKTTMLLKTPQVAGALVGALLPFKEAGINLTSIQSKLIANTPFEMMFFVEFDAGLQEERTQKIIKELQTNGYIIDILGSYKSAVIPINAIG